MASYEFPASGAFEVPILPADFTGADFAAAQEAFLSATKHLLGAQSTIQTIAPVNGFLTPEQPIHLVDTEGGAASDTVGFIGSQNFRDGELLLLLPYNPTHVVTFDAVTSQQTKLQNDEDFVMDATNKALLLVLNGGVWYEVFRTGRQPLAPHGKQIITASGNWTVPKDVYTVWVTLVGGGGGGGGGAGGGTGKGDGAAGTTGGNTTFLTQSASGGGAGQPGLITGLGGYGPLNGGGHGQTNIPGGIASAQGGRSSYTVLGQYGQGGTGGRGEIGGGGGGSGGISAMNSQTLKRELSVTPGQVVAVTIGAGGTGGAGGAGSSPGQAGSDGAAGAVLVEW